jgi:hypothetical protein
VEADTAVRDAQRERLFAEVEQSIAALLRAAERTLENRGDDRECGFRCTAEVSGAFGKALAGYEGVWR